MEPGVGARDVFSGQIDAVIADFEVVALGWQRFVDLQHKILDGVARRSYIVAHVQLDIEIENPLSDTDPPANWNAQSRRSRYSQPTLREYGIGGNFGRRDGCWYQAEFLRELTGVKLCRHVVTHLNWPISPQTWREFLRGVCPDSPGPVRRPARSWCSRAGGLKSRRRTGRAQRYFRGT